MERLQSICGTKHEAINPRRRVRGPGLHPRVGRVPSRGVTFDAVYIVGTRAGGLRKVTKSGDRESIATVSESRILATTRLAMAGLHCTHLCVRSKELAGRSKMGSQRNHNRFRRALMATRKAQDTGLRALNWAVHGSELNRNARPHPGPLPQEREKTAPR